MLRLASLAALFGLLVGAGPLAAQPAPAPPDRRQPPAVEDPRAPGDDPRLLRLRGSLTLEGEYNDNFLLAERDKQDEFRELLTPRVSLRLVTGGLQVTAAYAPSLVHSSIDAGEVRLFHDFDADARWALTERLTLTVVDRFRRTDDPAVRDPRGVRRGRATLTQNAFTSDLTYRYQPWSVTPRYVMTLNETEATDRTQAGDDERSRVHQVGVDATVDILRRNTLGAGYELTLADFDLADDFVGHRGRLSFARALDPVTTADVRGSLARRDVQRDNDFDLYRGDVGIRREVGPLYTVEVRGGYGVFDPKRGSSEGAPEYLLRGTYTGQSVRIRTSGGQSFQETFLEGENVGVTLTREVVAEVRYDLTDRFALTVEGRYARNRFLQATTTRGVEQTRDELLGAGLGVDVRLSRTLVLSVGYTHTTVDSNVRGLDYQVNRVRLGLTATYE